MLLKLTVIILTALCLKTRQGALVLGFLFGGPPGQLLPNNPVVCTTQNITLTCTIADPSYTSEDITFDIKNPVYSETKVINESSTTLTLINVSKADHNANIICCVKPCTSSNHIVEGPGAQILQVYEYPTHVVNFFCVRYGWENKMTCDWELGQDYTAYPDVSVSWRIPSLSASWTPCPQPVNQTRCRWDIGNGSISDRDIQVLVNISSKCGISVSDIFDVNTSMIVKPEPVNNIQVKPITSTSVNVSWYYKVWPEMRKQFKVELQSKWNDTIEPRFRDQKGNISDTFFEEIISGLVPNTEYTILMGVKPMLHGFWSDTTSVKATTLKDVPFETPQITDGAYMWNPAQCDLKDRRTVYLYFKPIPAKHENGLMKEIIATSSIEFFHNSFPTNRVAVPAHHTQISMELDCNQDYDFEVWAVNEIGRSAKNSLLKIPEAVKGRKPPEIIVETSGSQVYLNWTVDRRDRATGFTAFYCKRDRGNCNNTVPVMWKKIAGNTNTCTLDISSPEEFLYGVSMETEHGSTGMVLESCVYAVDAEPQRHPDPPSVSVAAEDNTLAVYWNKILCKSDDRYFPQYKVVCCEWAEDIANCSAVSHEFLVPATQTSLMIGNLKEKVKYGVMVQGVTADGLEGPLSEPSTGIPENNSLKPTQIGGIAAGGFFGFVLIIAGAVAIFRHCKKKAEVILKGPEIAEIPITFDDKIGNGHVPDGYANQTCLDNSLNDGRETVIAQLQNGYISFELPMAPANRTERQISADSGIPEELMTPKQVGDNIFPAIEETASQLSLDCPFSPNGMIVPQHLLNLPTGYSRVNTEDVDKIPRIRTYPEMFDNIEKEEQKKLAHFLSQLQINDINMTVFRAENEIPKSELGQVSDKAKNEIPKSELGQVSDKAEPSEPISSYTQVHTEMLRNNEVDEMSGNGSPYVPISDAETTKFNTTNSSTAHNNTTNSSRANISTTNSCTANSNTPNVTNTKAMDSKRNDYLPHSLANTGVTIVHADIETNSPYIPLPAANLLNTNSRADNCLLPSSASQVNAPVSLETDSPYIAPSKANMVNTAVPQTSTNIYHPISAANTRSSMAAVSPTGNYLSHSAVDMTDTKTASSLSNPAVDMATNASAAGAKTDLPLAQTITLTTTGATYVPHSVANMPNSTLTSSYLPHSSACLSDTSAYNASAKNCLSHSASNNSTSRPNDYLPHFAADVPNAALGSSVPHLTPDAAITASDAGIQGAANNMTSSIAISSANNYLPHFAADVSNTMLTRSNMPHPTLGMLNINSNSSANNCLPHSTVKLANTTSLASNANGYVSNTTTGMANVTLGSSCLPHSTPSVEKTTSDSLPHPTAKKSNITNVFSNTDDYVSHSAAGMTNATLKNGYLPNSVANAVKPTSGANNYLPHSSPKIANTTNVFSNTDDYVPHSAATLKNGYLPHSNTSNSRANNYLSHATAKTSNLPNVFPNTDGYVSHSAAGMINTT